MDGRVDDGAPWIEYLDLTIRMSVTKSISSHERQIWCLLCGVVFPLVVCADHGISSHRAVILQIINEPDQIEMIV